MLFRSTKILNHRLVRERERETGWEVEGEGERERGAMWKGISCGFNYCKDK